VPPSGRFGAIDSATFFRRGNEYGGTIDLRNIDLQSTDLHAVSFLIPTMCADGLVCGPPQALLYVGLNQRYELSEIPVITDLSQIPRGIAEPSTGILIFAAAPILWAVRFSQNGRRPLPTDWSLY
jgi:hypothetical protein